MSLSAMDVKNPFYNESSNGKSSIDKSSIDEWSMSTTEEDFDSNGDATISVIPEDENNLVILSQIIVQFDLSNGHGLDTIYDCIKRITIDAGSYKYSRTSEDARIIDLLNLDDRKRAVHERVNSDISYGKEKDRIPELQGYRAHRIFYVIDLTDIFPFADHLGAVPRNFAAEGGIVLSLLSEGENKNYEFSNYSTKKYTARINIEFNSACLARKIWITRHIGRPVAIPSNFLVQCSSQWKVIHVDRASNMLIPILNFASNKLEINRIYLLTESNGNGAPSSQINECGLEITAEFLRLPCNNFPFASLHANITLEDNNIIIVISHAYVGRRACILINTVKGIYQSKGLKRPGDTIGDEPNSKVAKLV